MTVEEQEYQLTADGPQFERWDRQDTNGVQDQDPQGERRGRVHGHEVAAPPNEQNLKERLIMTTQQPVANPTEVTVSERNLRWPEGQPLCMMYEWTPLSET
jgi:hypothetical protein